ncbi:hypothetical protein Ct9H90mP29_00270 [bacterium]|nr:MAG: hypothetical protein Ct9H90mP29_00270 [bacterium]
MKWLEKVIVFIDPCMNPDGRDRYSNFYRMAGNVIPNINARLGVIGNHGPGEEQTIIIMT